jgi:hypothetical protein
MSHTIELTKVAQKYIDQLSVFVAIAQDTESFIKLDEQTREMITGQVNSYFSILAGVSNGTIEII